MIDTIERWHQLVRTRDLAGLPALLHDDVVFHSPILHKPQAGKALTQMYLTGAFFVFLNDTFHYVREVVGERDAMLEFETTIDGIHVNGVDLIRWGDDGRIVDFKVMVRPLKAVELIRQKMAAVLAKTGA